MPLDEQDIDRAITDILASAAERDWEVMVTSHYRKICINGSMLLEDESRIYAQALNRMVQELGWLREESDSRYLVVENGKEAHSMRSSQSKSNGVPNKGIATQEKILMQNTGSKLKVGAQNLSYDIKWKIAEDFGVSYSERSKFFDEHPDYLVTALIKNMGKEDRNRAVLDLLLEMENAEHTKKIITLNVWLMGWTAALALATFVIAGVEVWNRVCPTDLRLQKNEIQSSAVYGQQFVSKPAITIPLNVKGTSKSKLDRKHPNAHKS